MEHDGNSLLDIVAKSASGVRSKNRKVHSPPTVAIARRRERKGSVELYAIDNGTTNDERPCVPAKAHMKSMKGTKAFVAGVTFDPNKEVK